GQNNALARALVAARFAIKPLVFDPVFLLQNPRSAPWSPWQLPQTHMKAPAHRHRQPAVTTRTAATSPRSSRAAGSHTDTTARAACHNFEGNRPEKSPPAE